MTDLLTISLIFIAIGVFGGVIGGMLGLGGGIVIVPILYFIFQHFGFPADIIMHLAVTTSLATIIVTSISASWAHHKKQAVLWPVVVKLAPGIVIGCIIGASIADMFSSDPLRKFFGIFEILVALQVVLNLRPKASRSLPEPAGLVTAGTGIGVISTIMGIGGGTVIVPFFLWCNVAMRNAVATSSACGLPIAIVGTITMIILGMNETELPEYSIGYLYWPAALMIAIGAMFAAPFGAKLAHQLPVETIKRIFSIILFIVGIKMVIG